MYVVVGATGRTGSVVAETLLTFQQPVRVVVRSVDQGAAWKAKGVEVAVASYEDVPSLTRAFRGAQGAYVLGPPNYESHSWLAHQRRMMDNLAEAVTESGIVQVVMLSSVGAQIPEGTGPIQVLHYGERQLRTAAKNLTILRPCYFIENWASVIGMAHNQGVLPTFLPPTIKVPMISTKDIGRVGAEQLRAGHTDHRVVELAGPEEYSPEDVAAALSQILGRTVTAQAAPLSAVVPTLTSFGFSTEAAQLFEKLYRTMSNGHLRYENPAQLVRGSVSLTEALRGMV